MSRIKITITMAMLVLAGCVTEPSSRSSKKPSLNLDAVLPPESLLRKDTLAALRHDRSQSKLAYVGVWASNGDKCAMMDQTSFEGFAVITPDSIRRSNETCEISQGKPGSAVASLDAICKARGRKTTSKKISIRMLSSRELYLGMSGTPGTAMVRCRLLPTPVSSN